MTRTLFGLSGKYTDDACRNTNTNNIIKYNRNTIFLLYQCTMDDSTTQENDIPKKINTKGDAMVNIIHALSDLSMVTSEMTLSVNHLKEFILDQIDEGPKRKIILKQINLIEKARAYIQDKVTYVTSQSSLSVVTRRTESRKRAANNLELKVASKIRKCKYSNYIRLEDDILAKMVQDQKLAEATVPRKLSNRKMKILLELPPPKNNNYYSLSESFSFMDDNEIKPNKFISLINDKKSNPFGYKVLCHRGTLYRKYNTYQETGVQPKEDDYGIRVGAPPVLRNNDLLKLNDNVKVSIGYAENNSDLSKSIVNISEDNKEIRGDFAYTKNPSPSTVKLYQVLTVKNSDSIHLVKDSKLKVKDKRRQMASMSVRNLASHISAVSYANFIPSPEKWEGPPGLPRGCIKLLNVMRQATGAHFQPIMPHCLLNEDCTSQYYFTGSALNDASNNGWSRVSDDTLLARGKDSVWTNNENANTMFKAIRVKFACGGCGSGFIYPICILVSNLSLAELPTEDFYVQRIKGLSINSHIDPRSEEIGYLCLMRSNVSQQRFFDWFYKNITCETILAIRKRFNPMGTIVQGNEEIAMDQRFVMWGDSDIPYLQQMTTPHRVKASAQLGLYFAKIGAKITENAQPLDLGPFFKILKISGKHMTSVDSLKPLTMVVDITMKRLRKEKILLLPTLKECALKDLLVTTPEMMTAAFNERSMVKSFVSSGMLDSICKRCPDLYGLVSSFKINWSKVKGGKEWFMKMLPAVIGEMHSEGEVSEQFYDDLNFPLDQDIDGGVWKLNSTADHLTRSKVLYHPTVIEKKKEELYLSKVTQNNKVVKAYEEAVKVFELNIDCEAEVFKMLEKNITDAVLRAKVNISMATIEIFDKLKVKHLSSFYRCRVQEDLMKKIKIPQKGNLQKVAKGEVDKTTNGPFLIQLCLNVKNNKVIAMNPVLPETECVSEDVAPPVIITELMGPAKIHVEDVTHAWMEIIPKVLGNNDNVNYLYFINKFENEREHFMKYLNLFTDKMMSRLQNYISIKIPSHKTKLLADKHWVWNTFRSKVKKIAVLLMITGHVVDYDKLLYKSSNEALLGPTNNLRKIDLNGPDKELIGNYVLVDKKRTTVIYSSGTVTAVEKEWTKHFNQSMLAQFDDRINKLSTSYPTAENMDASTIDSNNVKGKFTDLQMSMGICISKNDTSTFVDLFEYSNVEMYELDKLMAGSGKEDKTKKKYRHLINLIDLAYSLCMSTSSNLKGEISCAWQLQYE